MRRDISVSKKSTYVRALVLGLVVFLLGVLQDLGALVLGLIVQVAAVLLGAVGNVLAACLGILALALGVLKRGW